MVYIIDAARPGRSGVGVASVRSTASGVFRYIFNIIFLFLIVLYSDRSLWPAGGPKSIRNDEGPSWSYDLHPRTEEPCRAWKVYCWLCETVAMRFIFNPDAEEFIPKAEEEHHNSIER